MVLAIASVGCSSDSGTSGTTGGNQLTAARAAVVSQINQLRAAASLPALTEWTAEESCADGEAQTDAAADSSYKAFGSCGEAAENECQNYPSTSEVATGCAVQMWAEGPGDFSTHGDYTNMSNTTYHKVAIGFATTSTGTYWAIMAFAP
jgi:uncharacterized protein YkwD